MRSQYYEIKYTIKKIALILLLTGIAGLLFSMSASASVPSSDENVSAPTPLQAGTSITRENVTFSIPEWTNKGFAVVSLSFAQPPEKIYAKMEKENEWIDITVDKNFKVTENGLLYIKTVIAGNEIIQSEYIECFDRTPPKLSYSQDGSIIYLSGLDSESGIKAFYANDEKITTFSSFGKNVVSAEYVLKSTTETVMLYVEDGAGNVSTTTTIKGSNITNSPTSKGDTSQSNESSSGTSKIGNSTISITVPEWTNKESALVKVAVSGKSIDKVEAKIGRDGKWNDISTTMDFSITENAEVYVKATDTNGSVSTVSETISCFDRVAPVVTLTRDGDKVNALAIDEDSGIKVLYINGKPYTSDNATISITETTTISAQARDNAGNMSAVANLKVTGKAGTSSTSSSDSGTATKSTGEVPNQSATPPIIQIGGDNYTIQELQDLGIPIYVVTGANDQTIQDIFDTQYTVVNQENIITYEHQLTSENTVNADSENNADADENSSEIVVEGKTKKGNSPIGFILLAIIVAVGAGVFLFYYKHHSKKADSNDLYESEYDPDQSVYHDEFDEDTLDDEDVEY